MPIGRHETVSEETEKILQWTLFVMSQHRTQFIMDFWFSEDGEEALVDAAYAPRLLTECESVGCFACWICAVHPRELEQEMHIAFQISIKSAATNIARLSITQRSALFHLDEWPSDFEMQYLVAEPANRFNVLKERVKHFIETGE